MKTLDLTGMTFGRLTVVSAAPKLGEKARWVCSCSCGGTTSASTSNLRAGLSKSCGCGRKESLKKKATHGMSGSKEYAVWTAMIQRCSNPKRRDYKHYGGRGIKVCARWVQSFADFLSDLGSRPSGLTLDRIDVNGDYEPTNCRWATWETQQNNKQKHNGV